MNKCPANCSIRLESAFTCSGSHLKLAGLAFSAVSSSDYLPLIERAGSDYLHLSLHSTPPARIPS
jgi:hypothetical protein